MIDNQQTTLEMIADFYGVTVGELHTFQMKCSIFSAVVIKLCKHLNWHNLYNILN